MARSERDQTREVRDQPMLSTFPDRNEHEFSSECDYAGRTGGEESTSGFSRGQGRKPERERGYALHESKLGTLTDIGTFRALAVDDLTWYRYGGDRELARRDLENLLRRGLIQFRTTYPERTIHVTLTDAGHRVIDARQGDQKSHQRLYHGFVKPRETQHDVALYRLYQQELERIKSIGGRLTRVILDFELKQSINRRLAKLTSLPKSEQEQEKQEIAQGHGLRVVDGKILLPDLRLEFEGPDREITKVDLELVTHHYHRKDLAAKAEAGFAMYASPQDAVRLRPAMFDLEIMQGILSL